MAAATNPEDAILAAAREVFVRKGLAGARMAEIADRAGINKALLHYYFRSKDLLFQRIFLEAIGLMTPVIQRSIGGDGDVREKLNRLVDAYIAVLEANPHVPVFVMHELSTNPDRLANLLEEQTGSQAAVAGFLAQLRREAASGKIAPVHPIHLILSALSMLVFPYIARPFVRAIARVPDEAYSQLLAERAPFVKSVLRAALSPAPAHAPLKQPS